MARQLALKELVARRFAIDGPNNIHSKVEFEVRFNRLAPSVIVRVGPGATAKGHLSKKIVAVSVGRETTTYDAKYEVELVATIVAGVRTPEL